MTRLAPVGVALIVFAVSLAIRLPDLDRFATIDESRWIQRGADFWTLIRERDYEDTFIIGHPGVTTMWLVGLGLGQERVERMATKPGRPDVTRREGYLDALVSARRTFVLAGSGAIALIALLAWRLVGPFPGALSGLLLAVDPFLAAHNQVAHLDATLSGLMALAFLSAALAWFRGGSLAWLALTGATTGLALLTKAPSIYLLGVVPLMAGWSLIGDRERPLARRLGRVVLGMVIWTAVALTVCWAVWPALQVNPVGTIQKLVQFTLRVGGGEHDNFFLGQPTDNPGWLYYPTTLAFRLGLGTLAGLVLAALLARSHGERRAVTVALSLFMLGFVLLMNVGPKQFDRYLLPLFPLMGVLAGLGWQWAASLLSSRRSVGIAAIAIGFTLQVVPTLLARPYYLAYYNPLLGGGAVAQRVILVGWGEGLAPVADFLDAQPIILGAPTVASSYHRVIQAHMEGSAVPLERVSLADYVVPYVNTLQRGLAEDVLGPIVQRQEPLLVVRHNGIEYARLYRGPHFPERVPVGVRFGDTELVEALIAPGAMVAHPGEEIQVLLRWRGSSPGGSTSAIVRLTDPTGQVVGTNARPIGADGVGGDLGGAPDVSAELHVIAVPARTTGVHDLMVSVGQSGADTRLGRISIEPAPRE